MRVVDAFSWLFTRIALTLLFFTVFVTYSVILRIIGKDPLNRTIDHESSSYWDDYYTTIETLDDFRSQY